MFFRYDSKLKKIVKEDENSALNDTWDYDFKFPETSLFKNNKKDYILTSKLKLKYNSHEFMLFYKEYFDNIDKYIETLNKFENNKFFTEYRIENDLIKDFDIVEFSNISQIVPKDENKADLISVGIENANHIIAKNQKTIFISDKISNPNEEIHPLTIEFPKDKKEVELKYLNINRREGLYNYRKVIFEPDFIIINCDRTIMTLVDIDNLKLNCNKDLQIHYSKIKNGNITGKDVEIVELCGDNNNFECTNLDYTQYTFIHTLGKVKCRNFFYSIKYDSKYSKNIENFRFHIDELKCKYFEVRADKKYFRNKKIFITIDTLDYSDDFGVFEFKKSALFDSEIHIIINELKQDSRFKNTWTIRYPSSYRFNIEARTRGKKIKIININGNN